MYLLSALAAGLVRCIHIDRLHKLSEGISYPANMSFTQSVRAGMTDGMGSANG